MATTKRTAFTVIELLCVIAIIASLAALLFPIISAARTASKQTVCLSNLSQIGKAVLLYRADYDDRYPYAVTQFDRENPARIPGGGDLIPAEIAALPDEVSVLKIYTKSLTVFSCPLDTGVTGGVRGPVNSAFLAYGSSYDFPTYFRYPVILSSTGEDVSDSPRLLIASDASHVWHTEDPTNIFNDRLDLLLADGHVKNSLFSNKEFY